VLAVILTTAAFPYFKYITGLPLTTFSFSVPGLWITTLITLLGATLIAGAYPFFSLNNLKSKPLARNALLTFQFVSSLTMMALVVMASLQLDFMRDANRNFDTSNIVTVYNPANYTWKENSSRRENNEAFSNLISQIPSVVQFTTSSAIPGEAIGFTYTDLAKRSMSDPDRQIHYKVMYVGYDFISLFGLELIAGRNYSPEHSEEWNIVVTENTIRELGFPSPKEAINQKMFFNEPDDWHLWTIIGVVKDYRHQSIQTPIGPTILRLNQKTGQLVYYSFKITDANAVPVIEKAWKEIWPGKPFDYYFMDQHYDQQYKSEIHFSRVFMLFSGVAVFIACLGVMGMSLFEANARIKEIGIRKVLGAEVKNIVFLLTKGSVRVLTISLAIAAPLVYLVAGKWLTTYPEHIGMSIWFVAAPFALLLSLVLFTSITQVLKTAIKNPVDALKHE
jgi:putative ABC transport system permease protein